MIYTLTLNPSLDYVALVKKIELGCEQRTEKYNIYPGGKGINVSQVLKSLGIDSTALGFVAGYTGECLESILKDMDIPTDFIRLENGITRINMKIRSHQEMDEIITETDINGVGPKIEPLELQALLDKLEQLQKDDVLVISGSVPPDIDATSFGNMIEMLTGKGVCVVVDAVDDYLCASLPYGPFLVKPNADELGRVFDTKITSKEEAAHYAKKLKEMGAQNVLVSLGGDGAILITINDKIYAMDACEGTVVNTVGAGDSMVAGFLAGIMKKADIKYAMKLAVCAGGATAFNEGLADRAAIENLFGRELTD